jgi:hypothetical protein
MAQASPLRRTLSAFCAAPGGKNPRRSLAAFRCCKVLAKILPFRPVHLNLKIGRFVLIKQFDFYKIISKAKIKNLFDIF